MNALTQGRSARSRGSRGGPHLPAHLLREPLSPDLLRERVRYRLPDLRVGLELWRDWALGPEEGLSALFRRPGRGPL
jgi:hypothetical protein